MKTLRTVALSALIAASIVAALFCVGQLAQAKADPPPPNCAQQYWLYGGLFGRGTTRTICDGPVQADGSWERRRNFYDDERYVPMTCSWGRYGGSCNGGYWLKEFDTGVETYIVTPETVLPDEPGHLGPAGGPVA